MVVGRKTNAPPKLLGETSVMLLVGVSHQYSMRYELRPFDVVDVRVHNQPHKSLFAYFATAEMRGQGCLGLTYISIFFAFLPENKLKHTYIIIP